MSAHVTATRQKRVLLHSVNVRRSPTPTTLLTLVHALVVTKVDYCSPVLSGIFGQLLQLTTAAVCLQRRRSSRVLGEEVEALHFSVN